ncbi:MAG: hypothetical protein VX563_06335 [Planctomycetota bacterium]|nr:hypothetical protein [Planctomycetota bacterium]
MRPRLPHGPRRSGTVDGADLTIFLGSWGCLGDCAPDFDDSGTVDGADLTIFLGSWGGCA